MLNYPLALKQNQDRCINQLLLELLAQNLLHMPQSSCFHSSNQASVCSLFPSLVHNESTGVGD